MLLFHLVIIRIATGLLGRHLDLSPRYQYFASFVSVPYDQRGVVGEVA